MKFRTDFVTNSSSSGFVAVIVNLKNGEKLDFECYYDSGYGGWFSQGGFFARDFNRAKNGNDIIDAIIKNTNEGKENIKEALNTDQSDFKEKLSNVKSVDEIESIEMSESTTYDFGESEDWSEVFRIYSEPEKDVDWDAYYRDHYEKWMLKYGEYVEKNPIIDFKGKKFAFSGFGTLKEERNHPVVQKVIRKGGEYKERVTGQVDYFVVVPDNYVIESKLNALIELLNKGKDIKMILAEDLNKALEGNNATAEELNETDDSDDVSIPFVESTSVTPSFRNGCMTFGKIDKSSFSNYLKQNGWFDYGECYGADDDFLSCIHFLIVGDETVKQIEEGNVPVLLKRVLKKQEEYKFNIISESEFKKLGNYKVPSDECEIESLIEKTVLTIGDAGPLYEIEGYIFNCGAFVNCTDDLSKCDYVVVGDVSSCDLGAYALDNRIDGKPVVFSKEMFLNKTASLTDGRSKMPVQPISCMGKVFMTGSDLGRDRRLISYIRNRGGEVLISERPSASKKLDYVVYKFYDHKVAAAEKLRYKGKKIYSISVDAFYKAAEEFEEQQGNQSNSDGNGNLVAGKLKGRVCCLTGDFSFGSKSDVINYIASLGGTCSSSVTKGTDMLIIGSLGSAAYAHGSYGTKYIKAKQMQDAGERIEILKEKEFFEKYGK